MIETLVTSKTRVKLLLKFFLNPNNSSYLRSLESEFNESTNGIRQELKRLEDANMLNFENEGNKKVYSVNTEHPLYEDVNNIVKKFLGLDQILEKVIMQLGGLRAVYLDGDLARGVYSNVIDLIFVGDLDRAYLVKLIETAESYLKKKIKYLVFTANELDDKMLGNSLLLWKGESKKE